MIVILGNQSNKSLNEIRALMEEKEVENGK